MKHTKLSTRSVLAGTLAAVLYLGPAAAWATCGGTIVATPNAGLSSLLYNVSALSANNAWAVGQYFNGTAILTLVEHWNGTTWSIVPSPNVGLGDNFLFDVAALSSTNIWAVGAYDNGTALRTLFEHWNGTGWSVIPSPNIGTSTNQLVGISAISASAIWAVGRYYDGTTYRTLTEKWNGSTWKAHHGADVGSGLNQLYDVAAVPSYNRAWAVGYYRGSVDRTLVDFWPTSAGWSVVASPNGSGFDNVLFGVSAVPTTLKAWAVGFFNKTSIFRSLVRQTLIEKWNGSSWAEVVSPNVGFADYLADVAAIGPTNAWAVGTYFQSNCCGDQALALHWNGTTWSAVTIPSAGSYPTDLYGVAAVPGTIDLWAVGTFYTSTDHSTYSPLAELLHC